MRASLTICLFASLVFQRQCQFQAVSPEGIKQQVVEALQPYFPNAKSVIVPEQHAILALTCVQGVGAQFMMKITDSVSQDQDIAQKLGMIRYAPLLGGARYKYFVLVFDGGWIWYDIDTRRIWDLPLTEAAAQKYRQDCGLESE